MASERWRLAVAALLMVAGALATGASAREWSGAAVLALAGMSIAWPRARRTLPATPFAEPPPSADQRRFTILQAQVEALPVAAWRLEDEQLSALTSRLRRLAAPGGVRDVDALHRHLRRPGSGGPAVLETRGSRRPAALRRMAYPWTCWPVDAIRLITPLLQRLQSSSCCRSR